MLTDITPGWKDTEHCHSPGRFLPLHLLPVHREQLVQLGEELRGWGGIVLLAQDEPDPLGWRNYREKGGGKSGTRKSFLRDLSLNRLSCLKDIPQPS